MCDYHATGAVIASPIPLVCAATVLRVRREGRAFIPVEKALTAVSIVFVDHNLGLARDRLMIAGGRRAALVAAIQSASEPYSTAFMRAAAAEKERAAAAAASGGSGGDVGLSSRRGVPATGGGDDDDDDGMGGVGASLSTPITDESKMTAEQRVQVRGGAIVGTFGLRPPHSLRRTRRLLRRRARNSCPTSPSSILTCGCTCVSPRGHSRCVTARASLSVNWVPHSTSTPTNDTAGCRRRCGHSQVVSGACMARALPHTPHHPSTTAAHRDHRTAGL